jgi:hypothetical protein
MHQDGSLPPLPWAAWFAQANHGVPYVSRPAFRATQAEQSELHKVKVAPFSDQRLDRQQVLVSALLTACQSDPARGCVAETPQTRLTVRVLSSHGVNI